MRSSFHIILLITVLLSCITPPQVENDPGSSYGEGEFALILAEQGPEGDLTPPAVRITGLFMNRRGMPVDGITQLFKIPVPPAALASQIDICEDSLIKDDSQEGINEGFLELLDAGLINIRIDAETRGIFSRPFPDIVANIVGSFYQTEFTDFISGISSVRSSIEVESTGSAEVGSFSASVEMPASFKFTQVFLAKETPENCLMVQWNNSDPRSDFMMLKIVAESGREKHFIRCFVKDDGEFEVPAKLIALTRGVKSEQPLKIYGYRVRFNTFSASGMETGLIIAVKTDSTVIF